MRSKKYPQMSLREKKLASKYIGEEFDTKRYKPKQAVAIGIARAKRRVQSEKRKSTSKASPLEHLFKKHKIR